jgi:hypothetical protein
MNRRDFLKVIGTITGVIGIGPEIVSEPQLRQPKYKTADLSNLIEWDLPPGTPYKPEPVIMRSVPAGESIKAGNAVYFGPEMDRVYQGTDRVIGVALNDASAYDTVDILVYGEMTSI